MSIIVSLVICLLNEFPLRQPCLRSDIFDVVVHTRRRCQSFTGTLSIERGLKLINAAYFGFFK